MSLSTPEGGRFVDVNGVELDGEFLPAALAHVVRQRLTLLDLYPGICQEHVEAVAAVERARSAGALAVARAEHQAETIDTAIHTSGGSRVWDYVILGAAVLVAGVAGWGLHDISTR